MASSSGSLTVSFRPGPPIPAAIDRPAGAAGTVGFSQQWTPLHGKRPIWCAMARWQHRHAMYLACYVCYEAHREATEHIIQLQTTKGASECL